MPKDVPSKKKTMSKIVKQIGELDTKLSKNELVKLGKEHANTISLSEQLTI